MSKPKVKWDTSNGLDYKPYLTEWPASTKKEIVKPHKFPPLFKDTKLLSETDLEGRADGFQLVKKGDYIYYCHMFSGGFSVVDVKDPTKPEVVKFFSSGNPHAWNIKCRALGNILIVAQEWNFFEPAKYHVHPEYPQFHDRGPKVPVQSGIKIFDISKPDDPKLVSFFKTGEWSKDGGGNMCHRFWYDGHYAYLAAEMPGYYSAIMVIVDVSNPKEPKEVSKFWRKGQWIAGGERPSWPLPPAVGNRCQCHHPIVQGDRAYVTWFGLGGTIVDISNIKRPTLVSEFNYGMGESNHTFLPIKDRKYAIFNNEWRHTYMLDISDEKYPKVVGMFPKPSREFLKRGNFRANGIVGPAIHNIHENSLGPDSSRSDDVIYGCCGPAGLRIYDTSDPYRIEEIAYYVPGTPKAQYDPRGPLYWGVDTEDVWVDNKGLIYLSDYNCGLQIVEFKG